MILGADSLEYFVELIMEFERGLMSLFRMIEAENTKQLDKPRLYRPEANHSLSQK